MTNNINLAGKTLTIVFDANGAPSVSLVDTSLQPSITTSSISVIPPDPPVVTEIVNQTPSYPNLVLPTIACATYTAPQFTKTVIKISDILAKQYVGKKIDTIQGIADDSQIHGKIIRSVMLSTDDSIIITIDGGYSIKTKRNSGIIVVDKSRPGGVSGSNVYSILVSYFMSKSVVDICGISKQQHTSMCMKPIFSIKFVDQYVQFVFVDESFAPADPAYVFTIDQNVPLALL